jgi:hypothetical protein
MYLQVCNSNDKELICNIDEFLAFQEETNDPFFLVVLEFELGALHLLGRPSTT